MSAANIIQFAYYAYMAKPKAERRLYRLARRFRVSRIVAIGLGDLSRITRLLRVAQRYAPSGNVHFTGVDLFEMRREEEPPLPIIHAHRHLANLAKKVRLVPGEMTSVIPAIANEHPNTDMLLLSSEIRRSDLSMVEYYLPRMLHAGSLVIQEEVSGPEGQRFHIVPAGDFQEVAFTRRQAA